MKKLKPWQKPGYGLDFNEASWDYHLIIYFIFDEKTLYAQIDFPHEHPIPLPLTIKDFKKYVKINLIIGTLIETYLRGDLSEGNEKKFPGVY